MRRVAVVVALLGCVRDAPVVEDAGEEADAGATVDGAGFADAAPVVDAVVPPDAGPDPCDEACARAVECVVDACDVDAEEYGRKCLGVCARSPAFAAVVSGAETCATVVEFLVDRDSALTDACRRVEPPPELVPDGAPCPWECAGDEVCVQSRCVRPDGTCDTTYHCRADQACREGLCRPATFARCAADLDCDIGHVCRSFSQNPAEPGFCFVDCADGQDCPLHMTCQAQLGDICYVNQCGPAGVGGEVYGACDAGEWSGTCYPSAEGGAVGGETVGVCLQGGTAEVGEACDAQAASRAPTDVALRCDGGAICFGDPDNPLDPASPNDRQGSCVALCDPRVPACAEGSACIDFTSADDPSTPFDETTWLGACLPSDCDVLDPDECPEGMGCRVITVLSTAGRCEPAGDGGSQVSCAGNEDCAGNALCGNNGRNPMVCLPMCDPEGGDPGCAEDELCFRAEDRWRVGFCLPRP